MSSSKCARCDLIVYPVEGLRCLDKMWHKGCFKCQECNMTLNMKNYKGFEKKPYCNAHCPQAKATTVADTPEIRRLAENTRIQSQAKYHEDFEKSKGKGFTAIADDPETLRLKNTSKIISNVAYHGELERKKQMEERRGCSGPEGGSNNEYELGKNSNNNSFNHQNRMQINELVGKDIDAQQRSIDLINQQQQVRHQQQQQQPQRLNQLPRQQSQPQYPQVNQAMPNVMARQVSQVDARLPTQQAKHIQQHNYLINQRQQQQQLLTRNQPQQHNMLLQQHQRHSFDSSAIHPLDRQSQNKHPSNLKDLQVQHMMNRQSVGPLQMTQQQQIKYLPMTEPVGHQPSMTHVMSSPQLIASGQHQQQVVQSQANSQRVNSNAMMMAPVQTSHHMMQNVGFSHQQSPSSMIHLNGALPKQQQQQLMAAQQRHMIHSTQMPIVGVQRPQQLRPNPYQLATSHPQIQQHFPPQVPRRVFRAMYDYVANDIDEVSFFENDILVDCVNVDGNWLIGKVARSGQTGMLPANYVAEISSH